MADPFLAETTALLQRTPAVLHALLDGLPDGWLGTPDIEGGWTPRDVVGHLISSELGTAIPRVEIILRHGRDRTFDPFDRFAHVSRDRDVPLPALVARFEELRGKNLARLHELVTDDAVLERVGRHPDLGEVTVREVLATWAVHDLDHAAQIYAGLAGSHDAEVGPWKANLGILTRREPPE